jgi:hypothetical protein
MPQDITKSLMGSTQSTFKDVSCLPGDIEAGKFVVSKSDGTYTSTLADGVLVGVSLGKDLSGTGAFFSVVRRGTRVPVLIDAFTPTIGAQVQADATSGIAVASGTAVNAAFSSARLDAVKEDGTTVTNGCALIDFPGGL